MNIQQAKPGTIRASLRYPAFRWLLGGLAVSQLGDWLYNLALIALVYERTHSALWAGITTAARVVPVVALGPLGGVVADRFDRRRVMITCDVARIVLMVLLALFVATRAPILLAPLIAAVATAFATPYLPCVAATTPRLVDDEDLPGANAARSAVNGLGIIAGPALGGVLLLLGSPALAFALNAVTFGLAALAVLAIPAGQTFRPARSPGRPEGLLRGMAKGAEALRSHPAALRLVGADIMCSLIYGAQTVLLLLVSRSLGMGAHGYGYLFAGIGAGALAGTALAGRVQRWGHPRLVLAAALAAVGLPMPLLAVAHWPAAGHRPGRGHRRGGGPGGDPHRHRPAADAGRGRVRPGLRARAARVAGRDRGRLAGRAAAHRRAGRPRGAGRPGTHGAGLCPVPAPPDPRPPGAGHHPGGAGHRARARRARPGRPALRPVAPSWPGHPGRATAVPPVLSRRGGGG